MKIAGDWHAGVRRRPVADVHAVQRARQLALHGQVTLQHLLVHGRKRAAAVCAVCPALPRACQNKGFEVWGSATAPQKR